MSVVEDYAAELDEIANSVTAPTTPGCPVPMPGSVATLYDEEDEP